MLLSTMPMRDPIELNLPTGGRLTLRVLTVRDNGEIDEWVFEDTSPRELALRILKHQAVSTPEPVQLDDLPDAVLAHLVAQWLHANDPNAWPDDSLSDLSTLQLRLREHYQLERERLRELMARVIGGDPFRQIAELQSQIARTFAPLSSTIANLQNALAPLHQIAPIIAQIDSITAAVAPMNAFASQFANLVSLPTFTFPKLALLSPNFADGIIGAGQEFLVRFHAAHDAATLTLESHQMRFVGGILPISMILRINELKDPARTHSVVARLGAWLRSVDFRDDLMESMNGYPRSIKRIAIMRDALQAHSEHKYSLSVPVFIAQAEGMLTDFLVQSRLVRRVGAKVYAIDPRTGAFTLGSDGKRMPLLGWDRKLQSARMTANAVMEDLATDLVSVFVPQRNAILHGHALRYAEHKQSVYALLVAAVTARALADLR
jgi:hypothetical protein